MAPADFRDYRAELQTFEGLAAYYRADLQLGDAQQPEHLRGMQVSAGFFSVLGHTPALGREFALDDELEGRTDVVMLGQSLWQRRFGGDPGLVGTSIRLSGKTFRVIGVLPDGVQHVGGITAPTAMASPSTSAVLPVPREEHPRHRYSHYYNVVGRVRPGVSQAQMADDLRRTGESVAKRYPQPNSPWKAKAVQLKEEIVGTAESTLVVRLATRRPRFCCSPVSTSPGCCWDARRIVRERLACVRPLARREAVSFASSSSKAWCWRQRAGSQASPLCTPPWLRWRGTAPPTFRGFR